MEPHRSRREAHGPRACGWTAIELLSICAILGVLTVLAAPTFKETSLNARRAERVNALLGALQGARSAAILRAQPVVVCKSNNGRQCASGPAATWSDGWIVFANRDRDSPPRVDPGEPVLRAEPRGELRVLANRDALVYWPVSLAGTTASIVFCDERGARAARAIIISYTGRARVSQRDASGRPLRCN